MQLYAHPFSSYCQKVLIALYENQIPFEYRHVAPDDAEVAARWPFRRIPVLEDEGRTRVESSVIIEHLDLRHPGATRWLPRDAEDALTVRFLDRFCDLYVMTPVQRIVFDAIRPPEERDRRGVADARAMLDTAYAWLEDALKERRWAAGDVVSLADCAAAPALFYADWVHPIGAAFSGVRAYRSRLLAWPAFARAVDEARPYRGLFPLGAPDRD